MLSDSFLPFFEWCGKTWLGTTVRDTVWAFPVIETFHLLALAILLGTVLIVNLSAIGVVLRGRYWLNQYRCGQKRPLLISMRQTR